jgi:hypothetical protein
MESSISRDCLPKLQLIIITGQNLKHSSSSMSNSNNRHLDKKQRQQALQSGLPAVIDASGQHDDDDLDEDEDGERAYSLMREVQEVLIEDFYPPISSSTVPNNPGRLLVDLTSLHTWNDDDDGGIH